MSRTRHVVATVVTLCIFGTAARADDDGEKKERKKDKKEKKEKKAQEEDDAKPEKKKADKKDKRIPEIGGYLQVRYQRAFDTDDSGDAKVDDFRVLRLRVKVKGKLIKKVSYNIEIDPRAPELTGVLRDAYLEFRHVPYHDIRVGQQKTQFGFENLESSTKLYTVNRSEVSDNLARGNTLRDLGVGIMGEIPIGRGYSVEDGLTVVNGAGQNKADDTSRKNVFGRLGGRFHCDDLGIDVRAGGSAAYGDLFEENDPLDLLDDERFVFHRYGADVEVDTEYAFVAAEVVTGTDRNLINDVETKQTGWYVLAAGKTPWHAGPIVRFDTLEDYERWTFGGFWGDVGDRLRAMVEYEHRKDKDDRLIVWTQGRF